MSGCVLSKVMYMVSKTFIHLNKHDVSWVVVLSFQLTKVACLVHLLSIVQLSLSLLSSPFSFDVLFEFPIVECWSV